MSRALVLLVLVLLLLVAGLVLLGRRPAEVAPHRIEVPVTLNGAADGAH